MNEMNITSAQYKMTLLMTDRMFLLKQPLMVSNDVCATRPGNRHYAEIMKQVAAGDLTIADAD